MTSYPAFCDHILHQNELVAAGICHGDTWNLIFINNMLGEILKLSPGRMDDEPFLPRLTRCGFDEVEESLSEPHGGELIAHHKEGSMYIIRWKSVSIDDSAGGEQVRLITMSKIPVDQINRVAELPWQELTVLLDSIHDGIWVIDSDGITLRVNKAMERIAGLRAEEVIGKHVTEPMHKGRFETCVTLRALIEKRSVTMFDDYSNGKRCLNTSTPIFDEKGNVVPVTVVEAGPCVVVQKKTIENDGYEAVQIGFGALSDKRATKAIKGHFAKADVALKKTLKEFRLDDIAALNVGDIIKADTFAAGDAVDVCGTSKGKGYAGVIKRFNAHSLKDTHGTGPVHRHAGSNGACSDPSRVMKGKKLPGHLGAERVTVQNLAVVKIDAENNLIAIKGAIPGAKGGIVTITDSVKA